MTKKQLSGAGEHRRGAVMVLVAALMIVLVGITALAIDYSFLLKMRTDMQRAADASVLAAVQSLVPTAGGSQDLAAVKATLRDYVNSNLATAGATNFSVIDRDIEIGRYDPDQIYSSVTLLDSGTFDAVRVTLRRDGAVNPQAPLFFGRALGLSGASITVSATAVLQKAAVMPPGADILPFAINLRQWNELKDGDKIIAYGDGKMQDSSGKEIPGNWGTVDIGAGSNSTSELNDQIVNGLRKSDLEALHADGRISQDSHINGDESLWVNADTGLSSGLKSAVRSVHNQPRLIPLYDSLSSRGEIDDDGVSSDDSVAGSGNNLEYRIAGWGIGKVSTSNWNGEKNTWVELERISFMYDGDLAAKPNSLDLKDPVLPGVFAYPVLVE